MDGASTSIDQLWPRLQNGLNTLLTNFESGFPRSEWMQLYTIVYNYCTTNGPQTVNRTGASFKGEELYNRIKDFLQQHVNSIHKQAQNRSGEQLLDYYSKEWERFLSSISKFNHILQYLNRIWIKNEIDNKKEVYYIHTLCLVSWRDHMYKPLQEHIKEALLLQIRKDRDGEIISTSLVSNVVRSLVTLSTSKLGIPTRQKSDEKNLDIYNYFEETFLKETDSYYGAESNSFIGVNTIADYMVKVEQRLNQEKHRVETYLNDSTAPELTRTLHKVLIEQHKDSIQSEFPKLLENEKNEDLGRMYGLLSHISALEPLRSSFQEYVIKVGLASVESIQNNPDPKVYVEALLNVYFKFSKLVAVSFLNETEFVQTLDIACKKFIGDNIVCKNSKSSSKSSELLAKYSDLLLKKSNKNQEESEMEKLLHEVLILFKYLDDKDVFMTFYSKYLSQRLISGTSASEHLERTMLEKLKSTCGYEYTARLQKMFTDMALSKELNDSFKSECEASGVELGLDLGVLVLATGAWPLQPPLTPFSLPEELQLCSNSFERYYTKRFDGRKISWLHHLSKGEVKMSYTSTSKLPYTLQGSGYQIGVLLQFNQIEAFNFKELQVATQLNESVLTSTLRSLLKTKILLSNPNIEDPEKDSIDSTGHCFTLNVAYKSPKGRVKVNINVPMKSEAQNEKKGVEETMSHVIEERKLLMQAAIVRIMKARKKLRHQNLILEVVEQLQVRFKPAISLIKKCIDILIEKEYLERVKTEKDMYSYIA
jgi:cullin 1